MNRSKALKIGELAKKAGINLQTIRYYEREGLLPKPQRTESGYRQYNETSVDILLFIKNAKSLGLSLNKIRKLVSLKDDTKAKGDDVKNIIQVEINEVEDKIKTLRKLKKGLTELYQSCPGNITTSECPILRSLRTG